MQDSSHLTIILCSSVIKIAISQKQKFNRKNNNNNYTIPPPPGDTAILPEYVHYYGYYYQVIFMFSKKIIMKLFKIAPEIFKTHS
jgi:hypothetical protein